MIESAFESVAILKELKDYIIPLSEEEYSLLEQSIVTIGCKDPLVVWQRDNALILVDGHNRHRICEKHQIPFKIKKVRFKDLDAVKIWMVDNQMGRRNLTPDQLSYYRGVKYLTLKRTKGGYANVQGKGRNDQTTSVTLAEKFNVSESTVKRDAKFAQGLNIIQQSNPKLKLKILTGEIKVKKADIQLLTDAKNKDKIVIKNEADLHNKAKIIKASILDEVESEIIKIRTDKVRAAQKILNEKEPVFSSSEDKVRRIKGMIILAINKAINERDSKSIKELKKLIDRLENELF